KYEDAAKLLQPYVKEKGPEVLYILGLAAMEQKRYKEANKFFSSVFIASGGENTKTGYILARSYYKMGNANTAIAFLNKVIQKNSGYIKAYILKSDILVEEYGKRKKALTLLNSIDPSDLSVLSTKDQAAYYAKLAHLYFILDDVKSAKVHYRKVLELEPRSVQHLLKVASFLKKTGDASGALTHYKTVVIIDSDNIEAIIGRAESNALLGQLSKVRNGLFRVKPERVDDAALLTRIGVLLVSLGTDVDSINSLAYFDKAIEQDSSYIEAYLSKIFVLLELNKLDDARNYVDKLKKLKLDSFQYHLAEGIINHQDGEYDKAQFQLKKALSLNSNDDSRVFYHYGLLLYDQQKYQAAIKYLSRAYRISPENFPYRLALGRAYFAVKKYKAVIKTMKRNKYEEQKQYKALLLLSDSEYRQKHYPDALIYINRALELYGKSVRLYYTKGKILYAMRDFNAAQKSVDTALLVDMSDADSFLLYAKIAIATGDYKLAMDKINAAERIDDANPQLYLLKGVVAKNLDDYHQALKYFKKISKYPVLQKQAYQEIAECYKALGKQSKSLRYFEKAARQGNPKALSYLAAIYYDKGNLKKALRYYRRSYAKDKKNMETIKRMAYLYKEKEDFVKSLRFFQRYMKMLGDDGDPVEEEMIETEIHFLKKTMPKRQFRKMVTNPEAYDDEGISKDKVAKAKKLYMKARSLKESNPNQAKALFREVMTLVPKTNRYYRKAFKQFSKIK
ncbi:tetratricopeptide repeat protein, partial [bacterium]|nr:tetratricopeptide repeat protein [bacterium]